MKRVIGMFKITEYEKAMQPAGQYKILYQKRHMTVRIPRKMAETVEDFLKTELAAKMGFISKADVVTTAVRNLLTTYGYYETFESEK